MEIDLILYILTTVNLKSWMHITCLLPVFLENNTISTICILLKKTGFKRKERTFKQWKNGFGPLKDV